MVRKKGVTGYAKQIFAALKMQESCTVTTEYVDRSSIFNHRYANQISTANFPHMPLFSTVYREKEVPKRLASHSSLYHFFIPTKHGYLL